ncbi:metallophosphoesterase [Anaerobacillus sp. CMMVII]|uniref:metallophosphoesterase n=1 Tax=Anaerobacillus sp. CMMVII TaxID=2755588 RepID=UPI0021B83EDA|nr:metallophosphoesterase [Anaerobacillus sp. CMMVII]
MKPIKKLLLFILAVFFFWFLYYQNNGLTITEYEIQSSKLPESFEGFTIVQLSDLHNKSYGKTLPRKVNQTNPNIIVFTGDLVDQKNDNEFESLQLMEELMQIAPVYFVTGNHEWWAGNFSSLENQLKIIGVKVLRNSFEVIELAEEEIVLIGIDDPAVASVVDEFSTVERALEDALVGVSDQFSILLSHRPEMFSLYVAFEFDLIFSGHAHGGQIRLPFLGGLIAPNQGFFPKYTSGVHRESNSTMIINRGLGNSIIPQRLFNRPEIVVVNLERLKPF